MVLKAQKFKPKTYKNHNKNQHRSVTLERSTGGLKLVLQDPNLTLSFCNYSQLFQISQGASIGKRNQYVYKVQVTVPRWPPCPYNAKKK